MALHIVYGSQGNELIDDCLERIGAEVKLWPQKRAFLLVPEQTKADMERRVLRLLRQNRSRQGSEGTGDTLMLLDVVSFSRFSHRILSEIGEAGDEYIDDTLETMLIHGILREGRDDFRELSALSDRIGFVPEIQSVLGDFSRYHVTPDRLRQIGEAPVEPRFAAKMMDFALLIERRNARINELNLVSPAEDMKRLTDCLFAVQGKGTLAWPFNRISYLRDTSVYIAGFGRLRDFTPEETAVIEALSRTCSRVTITIPCDLRPYSKADIISGPAAFFFGRQTLFHLCGLFPTATVEHFAKESPRPPELATLAGSYAGIPPVVDHAKPHVLRPMLLPSPTEEVRFVAGEIRRLVLTEGYRYRDINVVLPDAKTYETVMHAVFAEFGLDPFLDKRRPLLETPLLRFVTSLLDLGISGWSFGPLMVCLKSGICHIPTQELDRFENFCLKYGFFRGYRLFDSSRFTPENDPDHAMQNLVDRVLRPLAVCVDTLTSAKTCRDKARSLLEFLSSYGSDARDRDTLPGIAGQIEALAAEWADQRDQDAALRLTASFNVLVELLNRLSGPVGDLPISLANFKGMLQAGLSSAYFGSIPSYLDQINISDTRRGALRPSKVLFMLGVSSDAFPYGKVKEGYLRGHERDILAEILGINFPSRARDQYYTDAAAAHALFDAPSDRLYLSCPQTKEPSEVFGRIAQLFPDHKIEMNPEVHEHDPRLFSRNALYRYIRSSLADPSADRLRLLSIARLLPGFDNELPAFLPESSVKIDQALLGVRYTGAQKMSVSQIETYAGCPYRHFSQYVLRLNERETYDAKVNISGTILHEVLENALNEYVEALATATSPEEKEAVREAFRQKDFASWAMRLSHDATDHSIEPIARDPLYRASEGNLMRRTATHSLRAIFRGDMLSDFEPRCTEWTFGRNGGPELVISTQNGRQIFLQGSIDRVDVDPKQDTFRVIDYKSGHKEVNYDALYHGLSVQLPVYLSAFRADNPTLAPAAAGYFRVTRPMVNIATTAYDRDAASIEPALRKTYKLRSIELDNETLSLAAHFAVEKVTEHCDRLFGGDFSVEPRQIGNQPATLPCRYCAYPSVCGIDVSRPSARRLGPLPTYADPEGKPLRYRKDRYRKFLQDRNAERGEDRK